MGYSLEKTLKQKAWHHDCITEVVELETTLKELGKIAQKIGEWINDENLKEWVKRELLDIEAMKMYGCSEEDIEGNAIEIANGIQVFLRKDVLGLFIEDSKEKGRK